MKEKISAVAILLLALLVLSSAPIVLAQPPAPTLISPENNAQTKDNLPFFTWEKLSAENILKYRLVVDNDVNFSDGDNFYDNANIYDNTLTIETELPPDNYWWHVAAGDGGIEIIPYVPPGWSTQKEIEIDCAKVEGENLDNFPVLISWGSDPDLAAHQLEQQEGLL